MFDRQFIQVEYDIIATQWRAEGERAKTLAPHAPEG
jgi:hypothetical protein